MPTFPAPKKYTAHVISKTYLNSVTVQVEYELAEPTEISFVPGQFISLSVGAGMFRSYSIASSNLDTHHLTLILTVAHNGAGANYVKSLKPGDTSVFIGPSGRFVLQDLKVPEILFMVTGTGITPILSMLYQLEALKSMAKIRLYFGVRTQENIFVLEQLEKFKSTLPGFDYTICVSNPSEGWTGAKGRITDFYKITDISKVHAYICGNPYMCADVTNILKDQGVDPSRIFHEKFTVSIKP